MIATASITIALLLGIAVLIVCREQRRPDTDRNHPISPDELRDIGIRPSKDYEEWYGRWYARTYWEGKL